MTDYFMGARKLGQEEAATLQQTQAAPAAIDYFSGARNLDRPTPEPAMAQPEHDSGRVGQFAPGMNFQPPQPGWTDTAADIAKSGGIGIAQGVLGVGSMPGNLEYLARAGIDYGAQALGYDNPNTMSGQILPTYSDYKADVERRIGTEFYEPRTTAGKYMRTAGEFAVPFGVAGRGLSAAQRTVRTLVPATVSETAGQMTEGTKYEPWARAAGAVAGSIAPSAGARMVSPIPANPERARQAAILQAEGVTSTTAGQRTGHLPLQWHEAVARDTPGAGRRPAQMHSQAAEQFTRATLRRAGIQADRATTDVIDGAFVRLGNQFDNLAQNATVPINQRLLTDLRNSVQDYNAAVAPTFRAPDVNGIVDDLQALAGGQINGATYTATRTALDRRAREVRYTDPPRSQALFAIRNALDDAVERSLPQNLRGQYAQTRREYRNLLTIEKAATGAGSDAAEGIISPMMLRNAAKTTDRRSYARGQGDLDELARAGSSVMTPLPQSGTGPRVMAQSNMHLLSGAAGYGVAGPYGIMAAAGPAIAARTLMSGPMQGYLGNQLAAPAYNALAAGRPSIAQHSYLAGPIAFEDR